MSNDDDIAKLNRRVTMLLDKAIATDLVVATILEHHPNRTAVELAIATSVGELKRQSEEAGEDPEEYEGLLSQIEFVVELAKKKDSEEEPDDG